jgi:hypothetical protein
VTVERVRSLGRGVAFDLRSPQAQEVRAALLPLAETPQDRQPRWQPHVTVQNKVEPAVARALLADLQDGFSPYEVTAVGLRLHGYLGGPWEPLAEWPFGTLTG